MQKLPQEILSLMNSGRLSGRTLTAVRRFAQTRTGQAVLLKRTMASYGIDALMALGPESLGEFRTDATPLSSGFLQKRSARWKDQKLGDLPVDTARQTAEQLRAGYLNGDFTPLDVFEALVKRIERRDFGLAVFSPFVDLNLERARQAALESGERYAKKQPLGPLDGVPVPLKDQHHMRGLPTRGGAQYREEPVAEDGFLVRALQAGGAVIFGKTHTTEWGINAAGFNPHFDMPRNVYNQDRGAGGSSTGAGVAVALGLSPVASGSDGGGSVRIPAAMNGVFGIKPTFARIGRSGDIFGGGTVSTVGPLGQSTRDLVDFLEVAAARADREDPASLAAPDVANFGKKLRASLGRGVQGCRIGIIQADWRDAATPLALAANTAVKALEDEGAELVDIDLPLAPYVSALGVSIFGLETLGGLIGDLARHGRAMSEEMQLLLALLSGISAHDYLQAQRVRAQLRRQLQAIFEQVDVLAYPTTAVQAAPYRVLDNRMEIADEVVTRGLTRYTFLANLTGLPAGTVPMGLHAELPMGLQIVGDAWDEASVLAVMAHCERLGLTAIDRPAGYRPFQ